MTPGKIFLVLCCTAVLAQDYAPDLPVHHSAIRYDQEPIEDPLAILIRQLDSGQAKLEFGADALDNLSKLLGWLGIPRDSQALVFSKTSFQATRISPANPRAIYFGDDAAIGYVRGSGDIEVAAVDPKQGVIFYTTNIQRPREPLFSRSEACLKCHQGPATLGVPGLFVGSVFPNVSGAPSRTGAIITDHRTAFEDRWGGWYVNARHGEQRDRANAVALNPSEPEVLETLGMQNLTTLAGKVDTNGYLAPTSDIVALMTFEHQTQMINTITRVGWEERIAQQEGKSDAVTRARLDSGIEAMIRYMLFIDEAPLKEPIEGVSTFAKTFPQRGPRDRQGRSLRDFDLQKRLFHYPLSYMVYSKQFDGLPESVRDRVFRRLHEVLTGKDQSEQFASLSKSDRQLILSILRETKPNLPAYWKTQNDR